MDKQITQQQYEKALEITDTFEKQEIERLKGRIKYKLEQRKFAQG